MLRGEKMSIRPRNYFQRLRKKLRSSAESSGRRRSVNTRRLVHEPLEQRTLLAVVGVLDDPFIVDTAGSGVSESDNVQNALSNLGHAVETIPGITAADFSTAFETVDLLLIPEQERGSLYAALTTDAINEIKSFVDDGGGLIVHGGWGNSSDGRASQFLRNVFEFDFAEYPSSQSVYTKSAANASNTEFSDDVDQIYQEQMTSLIANTPDVNPIYLNSGGGGSVVTLMGYGTGEIVFLGWDWQAPTLTSTAQYWNQILDSAVLQVAKPENKVPTAVDDTATVYEDGPAVVIDLTANDTDPNPGDDLEIQSVDTVGLVGLVVINQDNDTVTYDPNGQFESMGAGDTIQETFTYVVEDQFRATSEATVTVTLVGSNDAPVATGESYSVNEDEVLDVDATSGVLVNDADVDDGDALTANAVLIPPVNGTLLLNADGLFIYTPLPNFSGTDSFTYEVIDTLGASSSALVELTVIEVNDAPVAAGDFYELDEDVPLTVAAQGVLANDSDVDVGEQLVASSVLMPPSNGTLTLNTDGSFAYTPNENFSGTDSFTYELSDGNGGVGSALVNLTIITVNDAPVAVGDSYVVNEDDVLTVDAAKGVLANDSDVDLGDQLTTSSPLVVPAHGLVVLNPDGSFRYAPFPNYNGPDSFQYVVSDGNGGTDIATVDIVINPVNDAPVAQGEIYSLLQDEILAVDSVEGVLINDSDIDAGDQLTASGVLINPANGVVDLNVAGSFVYTPNVGYSGDDSFIYELSDGNGGTDSAIVELTIVPISVNEGPTAVDDAVSVPEDGPGVVINLTDNDTDPNPGDVLTIQSIDASGLLGSVVVSEDGKSVTYSPDGQFETLAIGQFTIETFTYIVADSFGVTSSAQVEVTILGINDAPSALSESYSVDEDRILTVDVDASLLLNDFDIDDGDELIVTAVLVAPGHGQVEVSVDGSFEYAPDADYNGPDSFVYEISDHRGGTSTAQVDIMVNSVIDAVVDVKPGSDSNVINLRSNGIFNVAILSTATVSDFALDELYAPDLILEPGLEFLFGDPAIGMITPTSISVGDMDGDGIDDLVLTFATADFASAADIEAEEIDVALTAEWGGGAISVDLEGEDSARIKKEKQKKEKPTGKGKK
jgi:VCBS repeat-containing protein